MSRPKRIGIDLDGCVLDFNRSYVRKIIDMTQQDLFGPIDWSVFPSVWLYAEAAGYTSDQLSMVWDSIAASHDFWATLDPLEPMLTGLALRINQCREAGHEFTFVTARPGRTAKLQSETSLWRHGIDMPTVLVRSDKDAVARVLELDAYLDDRLTNCNAVVRGARLTGRTRRVYILEAPYNRRDLYHLGHDERGVPEDIDLRDPALIPVATVAEMLDKDGLHGE